MGSRGRNHRVVVEADACRLRVRLTHGVVTDELEHEIATLGRRIAVVDQVGERRIDLQPTVRVTVGFMAHAVGLWVGLDGGGVDDCAGHGDAVLPHEQSGRIVDVRP
jgi:hypothetical protein